MIQATFTYTDEQQVVIGGSFTAQRLQQEIIHQQPYYFYYVNIGQRCVIRYERDDHAYGTIEINGVTYHTDSKGVLYYDCTDELRAILANGGSFLFLEGAEVRIKPQAGIDPELCLVPMSPLRNIAGVWYKPETTQILPPQVMLNVPQLTAVYDLMLPIYGDLFDGEEWRAEKADGTQPTIFNGEEGDYNEGVMTLVVPASAERVVKLVSTALSDVCNLQVLQDCEKACILRWQAEYGGTKQMVWKVKKVEREAEAQDLMPLADNYKQRKGESVRFTAYIEGLDAYSYAYYADIVTSPEVHCAMRTGEDLTSEVTRVAISSGKYVVPDGEAGRLQTLEVEVELKHYDIL